MKWRLNKQFGSWARSIGMARLWSPSRPKRGNRTHVIILDGTMSSLRRGEETNAGLTFKLLRGASKDLVIYYAPGIQWRDWKSTHHVLMGRGINRQIRDAYGVLASRYREGDRIFLFGYSRGAFAVRSLAGMIDRIGLVRAEFATERNIQTAYRHYQHSANSHAAQIFAQEYCHADTPIEMIGVWDTVKALGVHLPLLKRLTDPKHSFHDMCLSRTVKRGYHALAMNETRAVFEPILWQTTDAWDGRVEQVWFRGTHGDVGGQLGGLNASRPLANIPLVWMLQQADKNGLALPSGWEKRFTCNKHAPSCGRWSGWSKIFLVRRQRLICTNRSERIHESAIEAADQHSRQDLNTATWLETS